MTAAGCLDAADCWARVDDAVRIDRDAAGRSGLHPPAARRLLAARVARSKAAFDFAREPEPVRRALRQDDQRHELAPGPAAGRGRRPVRLGLLEGGPGTRRPFARAAAAGTPTGTTSAASGTASSPSSIAPSPPSWKTSIGGGCSRGPCVVVNSEMGRKPRIGDVRSGGVRGAGPRPLDELHVGLPRRRRNPGRAGPSGSSDKLGAYPADHPVGPEDVARTIFYAMGIDESEARDREGCPLRAYPPMGRR